VVIDRPAAPGASRLHLTTEALTIFPDEDRMQSDQKVQMALGDSQVSGTGMRANNATRQLDFASRGHIIYPPKAVREAPRQVPK
jgi:lipopolysaccharide export system protein LptC